MTNANWERVIDEGFYTLEVGDAAIKKLSTPPFSWGCISDHVTVVREKGLRQPHFVGDKHPECKTVVCVKIRGGEELFCRYAESINWDDVVEYIVL